MDYASESDKNYSFVHNFQELLLKMIHTAVGARFMRKRLNCNIRVCGHELA